MPLVLCTGGDDTVVRTRRLILERAGQTVITAMTEPAVINACRDYTFDVAVIGQTVSPEEKRRILMLVRLHCPSAKVLELYTVTKRLQTADDWLSVPAHSPQEFVDRVAALSGRQPDGG